MRQVEISAIEDNPADLQWLQIILREAGLKFHLTIAEDGEEAVDCLLRRNRYSDSPEADLVLLDVNLPKFGALEILEKIPNAATLPICMLTTSPAEQGRIEAYLKRHVSYIIKPLTREKLLSCLRSLDKLRPIAAELAAQN